MYLQWVCTYGSQWVQDSKILYLVNNFMLRFGGEDEVVKKELHMRLLCNKSDLQLTLE